MLSVYLAGPMMGCSDDEMKWWRKKAGEVLGRCTMLDPTVRDYRSVHAEMLPYAIVKYDLEDIAKADIVLVNADRPSWGTAQELVYAKILGKIVVAYCGGEKSPWMRYHSTVVKDNLEDALEWINKFYDSILEEGN